MKYLQSYVEDAQTKLFEETGAFFAFSTKQFEEQKRDGVEYVSLSGGMIVPKTNAQKLVDDMAIIMKNGIKKDTKENGKEKIILRELYNYESFYTGDVSDTIDCVEKYGFTEKDVFEVYQKESKRRMEAGE